MVDDTIVEVRGKIVSFNTIIVTLCGVPIDYETSAVTRANDLLSGRACEVINKIFENADDDHSHDYSEEES